MPSLGSIAALVAVGLSLKSFAAAPAPPADRAAHADPEISSLTSSPVTVYAASWCSACRSLERGLTDKQIPFDVIDVEKSPDAFEHARAAAGAGNSIPLTGIAKRDESMVWIVGADVDAVDRAYRDR